MKFSKLSLIRVLTTYHGWQHLYSNRILCITDFFIKMCRFDLLWCTPVHKHAMMKCFLRMLKVINNKMTLMAYSLCIHQSLHFWSFFYSVVKNYFDLCQKIKENISPNFYASVIYFGLSCFEKQIINISCCGVRLRKNDNIWING